MKKINRFLFSFLLVVVSFSFFAYAKAYSQTVTVVLDTPPQGKLNLSDFWNASLTNNSKETYKIYLFGTLTEKKAGLIATAITTEFDLKNGTKKIKASDFPKTPEITYPNSDPKYKEALVRQGSLPSGDYTYCLYAKLKKNNEELGNDCIEQVIEETGMISLITPGDGEEIEPGSPIIFTWMSSKKKINENYIIKIAEILEGQTPEAAIKINKAWFEQAEIKKNTFQYPKTANAFQEGKKYAWRIKSGETESEIFNFVIKQKTEDDSTEIVELTENKWIRSSNFALIQNLGQFDRTSSGEKVKPEHSPLLKASLRGFDFYLTQRGLSYLFIKTEEDSTIKNDSILGKPEENKTYRYRRVDFNFKNISIKKENLILKEPDNQGVTNYYYENCPQGILGVKSYKKAIVKDVYKNIDLVIYGNGEKGIKYEFIVHPEGNSEDIQFEIKGAKNVQLKNGTVLTVKTDISEFTEGPLKVFYQDSRKKINSLYEEINNTNFKLKLKSYDKNKTIIIDPPMTIVWGTYYGADGADGPLSLKTDYLGNVISCGYSISYFLIFDPGNDAYYHQDGKAGLLDAYIIKFDNNGVRLWATFYGGNRDEYATGVVINSSNDIYIAGFTHSYNLPMPTPAGTQGDFKPYIGGNDFYIARFNNDGVFKWGTFFGGNGEESWPAIAINSVGTVFICGRTGSSWLQMNESPFISSYNKHGNADAIIIAFDNNNHKKWVTYFGGNAEDAATSIVIDDNDNIFIAGYTYSGNINLIHTGTAYTQTGGGIGDIFIAKFNNTGELKWSTYLGGSALDGSGPLTCLYSDRVGINLDRVNNLIITSHTRSINFPVLNCTEISGQSLQGLYNYDVSVSKFTNDGTMIWSRYLGGDNHDFGFYLLSDRCNNIFVMGRTYSNNFPTKTSDDITFFDNDLNGTSDGFITKLSESGNVLWSTYLGTSTTDWVICGAFDINNCLFLTGEFDGDNPSAGAIVNPGGAYTQVARVESDDMFFVKFSPIDPCIPCINSSDNLIVNWDFGLGNSGLTVDGGPGYGYTYVSPAPSQLTFGNYTVFNNANIFTNQFGVTLSGTGYGGSGNFLIVSSSTNRESFWKQSPMVVPNTNYVFCAKFNNLIPISTDNPDPYISVYIKGNVDGTTYQIIPPTLIPKDPDEWVELLGYWNSGSNTSAEISMRELPGPDENCWYVQITPVTNSMHFNGFTLEVPSISSVTSVDAPQPDWSVSQTTHTPGTNKPAVDWKKNAGYTIGPITFGEICFNPLFMNGDITAWFSTNKGATWTCRENTQIDFHINPLCRNMATSNTNMTCLSQSGNNYLYNFSVRLSTPVNATITSVTPSRGTVNPSLPAMPVNPVSGSVVSGTWTITNTGVPYGLVSLRVNYTLTTGATCSEDVYFDIPSCSQTSFCPKVEFIKAGFNTAFGVDDIIFRKYTP
ncbi:MAG TPA: SBBP repeat-containing protein [Ignavibacteria bacterium]